MDKNIGRGEGSKYGADFQELIRLADRPKYEEQLKVKKTTWDPKFSAYYDKYVEKKVDMVCWWTVKQLGWKGFTSLSLWTSNLCEAGNNLFRNRLDYREVSLVQAIRHFRDWQRSTLSETARAHLLPPQGDLRVEPKFQDFMTVADAESLLRKVRGSTLRIEQSEASKALDRPPTMQVIVG